MIHMGVARKWEFSTSGGAANLGGVSGDLSEHRGSGIPLLGITSLFMHKLTGLIVQMDLQTFLSKIKDALAFCIIMLISKSIS